MLFGTGDAREPALPHLDAGRRTDALAEQFRAVDVDRLSRREGR